MIGGMVAFLVAENNDKLMQFYEKDNQFNKFSTISNDSEQELK
ncbi:hypothetical protein [Anaerotignum lactatifermentans]|nr:hypothetical protein [Anaerotignum lactatifermentans]